MDEKLIEVSDTCDWIGN